MNGSGAHVVEAAHELPAPGAVLAIGNFDGVHVGHRALLERMRACADAAGRPSGVLTFFPPAKAFFGGAPYLSSRAEKVALLRAFAPTAVAVVPFDAAYAATSKDAFVEELRVLRPHTLVVGEDFRFGHGRAGTLDDLRGVPQRLEVLSLRHRDGEVVKSSRIRELLADGEVARARTLLGAPYPAHGLVVRGDARGHTLGYPTANVNVPADKALPRGVFAAWVDTPRGRHGGMANVGPRPSFPDDAPTLEVHLFDFDADLYDREVTVWFVARLRGQQRFDGVEALRRQLDADAVSARRALDVDTPGDAF